MTERKLYATNDPDINVPERTATRYRNRLENENMAGEDNNDIQNNDQLSTSFTSSENLHPVINEQNYNANIQLSRSNSSLNLSMQSAVIHQNTEIHDNVSNNSSSNDDHSYDDDDFFLHMSSEDENIEEHVIADANMVGCSGYKKLCKLLQTEETIESIRSQPVASKIDVLLMCLELALKSSFSNTEVTHLFSLINCMFDETIFPDTRYLVNSLFNPNSTVKYHAICTQCEMYIGIYTKSQRYVKCNNCDINIDVKDESFSNFFITLDAKFTIGNLISQHSTFYDYVTKERVHVQGQFEDIYDGICYRQIVNDLKRRGIINYVTIIFNADGAPVFKSSTCSIWPLQYIVNEIPAEERLKSPILYGLWFGKSKVNMNVFLTPFVEEMNVLTNEGFQCQINGENRQIAVVPICCCVDSQARPIMQGLFQYNGHYACNWCLHPGVFAEGSVRYNVGDEVYPMRTKVSAINDIVEAVTSGRRTNGFVTASQLINLSHYDIINGFVPDYLHFFSLGISKQFTSYWLENPEMYTVIQNPEDVLDEFLVNVKVPVQVARRTRSIKDRKQFKGREWENWCLLTSLPILKHVLRPQYFAHWRMLVEAIYLLLQNKFTIETIDHADTLLHNFIAQTEELYAETAMVFNVHQLQHTARSVLNWGPLWSHSGYVFESGNGKLVKKIHAAKGVCSQVCRFIEMAQSVEVIKNIVPFENRKIASDFATKIDLKMTSNCVKFAETRYFGKGDVISEDLLEKFNILTKDFAVYPRIVRNSCLYSTYLKINRRSNNSFVILKDGTYVQLRNFLLCEHTGTEYTIVRKITTSNAFETASPMLHEIIEISNEFSLINTADILKPCIYSEILDRAYLCALPNILHY